MTELDALKLMMGNPGVIVKREQILDLIDPHCEMQERTVDIYIKRMRKKLENAGLDSNDAIRTIYGLGYAVSAKADTWSALQSMKLKQAS